LISRAPVAAVADADLVALIGAGADTLGLALSVTQVERLVAYVRLIEHWNGAYNLTAVREPHAMAVQHILDCLAVVAPLRRRMGAVASARLLDVGSGAGLPGAVIAAVEPALDVVCVDSVGKKAAFITHAAAVLGLKNLSAQHRRVEDLSGAPFDVIASRAFASLADFFAATRRLLDASGLWMAMKGKMPEAELAALPEIAFHVEPIAVPGLSADRCIVWASLKK
jgi:16S rRNA (guanine527-N7)-methyltransferase